MAFASSYITAYAVEATEFPDLARRYRVNGVPKTVVDEEIEQAELRTPARHEGNARHTHRRVSEAAGRMDG